MAFPSTPTIGQQYTQDGRTWQWDGVAWEVLALAGPAGPAGPTGATGPEGPAGPGVAAGGTAGQYLVKVDSTDYNTNWATLDLSGYALLSGATFTGTLSAPTPSPGTDSTVVATTEWVKQLDYAPLNAPQFVGNPRAPTPSLSDNDTSIATTAFVKGQNYITSAALSGYATESFVTSQGYITSSALTPYLTTATAASTYQTISGMSSYLTTATAASTYFTIASAANKADLASPTFTGTPSLPTGTTAVTQTAGNNTTAVATTAFVTAAVPAFATTAQVVAATSTTTALAPSNQGFLMTNPRLQTLAFINSTSTSGSGATTASGFQTFSRQIYLSSLATGRAAYLFGTIGAANAGFGTSTAKADQVDFSKKVWISGYAMMGHSGSPSWLGDANTMCRITLGGYSTNTTGEMTLKGIGLKKVGGVASTVSLTVHNGTTLTDVASSVTVADGAGIQWQIYSDGTGNVTLYINGTQAATTTAGPTTATASGQACYREQLEAVATPGVRQLMNCNGGWFYSE